LISLNTHFSVEYTGRSKLLRTNGTTSSASSSLVIARSSTTTGVDGGVDVGVAVACGGVVIVVGVQHI
jgi:hypothetical protein